MTRARSFLLLSALTAALASGCGNERSAEPTPDAAGEALASEPAAPAPEPAAEVAFEAAYPEDVSSEALSDEDVAQQEARHAHDGEEHAHGDDGHTHGEEEAHDDDHDH